ncbi:hypothetical protein V1498_17915 [Peribacillus sp. SCS-26]|uniref:hypothetical protein n=1 Tax=Paraperibacillus marinus TaxID=3115295 RepID=UPI003906D164
MTNRLILVEGLPGSGKSTISKMIYDILTESGRKAVLFQEGNPDHPADYEGVAMLTPDLYKELLLDPVKAAFLDSSFIMEDERHVLIPYRKLQEKYGADFPESLLTELSGSDVYEQPIEINRKLITSRWKQFAAQAQGEETIYIFECCFIQNPVTVSMVKYGLSLEASADYILGLAEAASCLNPLLIYIEQDDYSSSFKRAVDERPREWAEGFTAYYTEQGYGKRMKLAGLEGAEAVLKARGKMELEILRSLPIDKVKLNNSRYDQGLARQSLIDLISPFIKA